VEARAGEALAQDLAAIGDAEAGTAARAERAFLAAVEGDCRVPVAALAQRADDGRLRVRGLVAALDGRRIARGEASDADPGRAGRSAAEAALAAGGGVILAALREAGR
jgi:hydroxymethylbilane synthase